MKKALDLTFLAALLGPLVALAHGSGHVMGTIDSLDGDRLTLTSTEGEEVVVELTAETRILEGTQAGDRADIRPGSRVVVHYAKDRTAAELQVPAGD